MKTKQTIAIIGATENEGSSIAKNLLKHNCRLILTGRNTEKLNTLKDRLLAADTQAVIDTSDCAKGVSWEADIIILACPHETEKEIAEKIREVATGKIVISISSDLVASPDTSTAEELQKLLRHSKIVKVFNTTFISDFTDGKRTDSFLASNNGHALEVVSEIMATAGFNPVVVGDLSVCRTLEHKQRSASRLL